MIFLIGGSDSEDAVEDKGDGIGKKTTHYLKCTFSCYIMRTNLLVSQTLCFR